MRNALRLCIVSAVGLAAAACGSTSIGDAFSLRSRPERPSSSDDWNRGSSTTEIDLTNVVDVGPGTYPGRTYFYHPGDTAHVYWFDSSNPDAWNYRPVYRVGNRVYFLERDGSKVLRVYFDDSRARQYDFYNQPRWEPARRSAMRTSAREAWARRERDESGWRSRWDQGHRNEMR